MASKEIYVDYRVMEDVSRNIKNISDEIKTEDIRTLVMNGNTGEAQWKTYEILTETTQFGDYLKLIMSRTSQILSRSAQHLAEIDDKLADSY